MPRSKRKRELKKEIKVRKKAAEERENLAIPRYRHVENHIHNMGFAGDLEGYLDWCLKNGFKTTTKKSWREQSEEKLFKARLKVDTIFAKSKKCRNARRMLDSIEEGKIGLYDVPANMRPIYEVLTKTKDPLSKVKREKLHELVCKVDDETDLLDEDCQTFNRVPYAKAIINLLNWDDQWVRPIGKWKNTTHNSRRQFSSLARHLYAEYNVPLFLDRSWFEDNYDHQYWFFHIGQGGNIRKVELPIPYTKKMAHEFLNAPGDYFVNEALRWGQIHALDGNAGLCEAVRGSLIGNSFDNEEFWITVIRFLIANPMLDHNQIAPLIDFINNQRFVPCRERGEDGRMVTLPPVQPNMSMHRRDPLTLLRGMEDWHKTVNRARGGKGRENLTWGPHQKVRQFVYEEGIAGRKSHKKWDIFELCSSEELMAEGRAMRHCVGSYSRSCHSGSVSIWSMLCNGERQLTISVSSMSVIREARGKSNVRGTIQQRNMMSRWATKNGLALATYV